MLALRGSVLASCFHIRSYVEDSGFVEWSRSSLGILRGTFEVLLLRWGGSGLVFVLLGREFRIVV